MLIRDTDLVCKKCRWRAGHNPEEPCAVEPWPMIEVEPDHPWVTPLMLAELMDRVRGDIGRLEANSDFSNDFGTPRSANAGRLNGAMASDLKALLEIAEKML